MLKLILKKRFLFIIISIAIISIASIIENYILQSYSLETQKFEAKFHQKIKLLHKETFQLQQLNNLPTVSILKKYNLQKQNLHENGISLFIYQKQNLIFWSNNSVPISDLTPEDFPERGIVKLHNGWYYVIKTKDDIRNKITIGFCLIKYDYSIQNQYLPDYFQADFGISHNCNLVFDSDDYKIKDTNGSYLFSLNFDDYKVSDARYLMVAILYYLAIAFFIVGIKEWVFFLISNKSKLLILTTVLILIRLVMLKFHYPAFIYNLKLFSSSIYASSTFLPSLGSLIINLILVI